MNSLKEDCLFLWISVKCYYKSKTLYVYNVLNVNILQVLFYCLMSQTASFNYLNEACLFLLVSVNMSTHLPSCVTQIKIWDNLFQWKTWNIYIIIIIIMFIMLKFFSSLLPYLISQTTFLNPLKIACLLLLISHTIIIHLSTWPKTFFFNEKPDIYIYI